jgi:hypothetical protein
MSHTTQYGEFFITHNGDFSGNVQIHLRKPGNVGEVAKYDMVADLPYWLIERIVVAKVRQDRIAALERAGPDEILGYKDTGPTYD